MNLGTKINVIRPSFMIELGLHISKTDMDVEKIYNSKLETYKIVIALFQGDNRDEKSYFFEKTFFICWY